jgi:hypothetical protein
MGIIDRNLPAEGRFSGIEHRHRPHLQGVEIRAGQDAADDLLLVHREPI